MTVMQALEWLEGTALATLVRESAYGFPILVGIHILGLTLSVGTLLWVDVRLLGLGLQRFRVSAVYRGLAPWFLAGFAVMLVSGAILFAGFATSAYANLFFRLKMAAIALAAANAVVYHFMIQRSSAGWDEAPTPPPAARIAGFASAALWAAVIVAGRMISYTLF